MPAAGAIDRRTKAATRTFPAAAYAIALLAALLHMAPYWRAAALAPPGWEFTGNLNASPDFVQYRSWMRVTSGPLIDDRFTAEPNRPHLPVLFYYMLGRVSRWTGVEPEWVMAYAGALLAAMLALLLYRLTHRFFEEAHQVWWVFGALLFSEGLGGHLKLLGHIPFIRHNPLTERLILSPVSDPAQPVFEDYRGHFLFSALFDTHYLLSWLVATAAVFSLYLALRNPSRLRTVISGALFALSTLLHVYEGVTLTAIALGIAVLLWRKRLLDARIWPALIAAPSAAVASLAGLYYLQASSGLPLSQWREVDVVPALLFIAYPLAWGLIAWGVGRYWRDAGLDKCFLLGWALACTLLTLSGPFYPYPDRGTLTLQIPLYLIAGGIWFQHRPRVSKMAAAVAVSVLAVSPLTTMAHLYTALRFDPQAAFLYLDRERRDIVQTLAARASDSDILAAEPSDVLWLGPEYPGKHYCGHFFLTVDYDRKKQALEEFLNAEPQAQATFLRENAIRFLFVNSARNPARFAAVQGVALVKASGSGSLFEYRR